MGLQFSFDLDTITQWNFPVKVRGALLETTNPFLSDVANELFDEKIDPAKFKNGDSDPAFAKAVRELAERTVDFIFSGPDAEWTLAIKGGSDECSNLSCHEMASITGAYVAAWRCQAGDPKWASYLQFSFIKIGAQAAPATDAAAASHLPPGRTVGTPATEPPGTA